MNRQSILSDPRFYIRITCKQEGSNTWFLLGLFTDISCNKFPLIYKKSLEYLLGLFSCLLVFRLYRMLANSQHHFWVPPENSRCFGKGESIIQVPSRLVAAAVEPDPGDFDLIPPDFWLFIRERFYFCAPPSLSNTAPSAAPRRARYTNSLRCYTDMLLAEYYFHGQG